MRKAALLAGLAIAFPVTALFWPAFSAGRVLALRDAGHFYYPLFKWCAAEWGAGRVPLWNPYENAGVAVAADATASVFYPGKLIFALSLPFPLAYNLYLVSHVALAAASSYGLARAWQASRAGAVLAAIAYSCGGCVSFQYCNAVFLVGAAWLPLAVWAADDMLCRRPLRGAAWLAVILALMILGGDPQAAYHILILAGIYAVLLVFARPATVPSPATVPGDANATGRSGSRGLAGRLALVGLAGLVAVLLAAVQVLPSAEATRYSERAAYDRPRSLYEAAAVAARPRHTGRLPDESPQEAILRGLFAAPAAGSHHDTVFDFSIGPWRLMEFFWPNVGGRMFPTHRRWFSLLPAEGRTWTPSLYMGLVPILLGLSQFRLRSTACRRRWLSWLALFGILCSFGFYGLGWLLHELGGTVLRQDTSSLNVGPAVGGPYWLLTVAAPAYVYFRYPAKWLPVAALALSQLAAIGYDAAVADSKNRTSRVLYFLGIASALAALPGWWICSWVLPAYATADGTLGPFDTAGAAGDVLAALLHTAIVGLAGAWLFAPDRFQSRRTGITAAVVLLTGAELVAANRWMVFTAPASALDEGAAISRVIQAVGDARPAVQPPPRVFRAELHAWRPAGFRRTSSATRLADLTAWEHDTLFPKHHLGAGVALVESYGSLGLVDHKLFFDVARQHGPRTAGRAPLPQPAALRLLGTQWLVLPEALHPPFAEQVEPPRGGTPPDWPEGARLWKMRQTLPRAWIVHDVELLPPLIEPAAPRTVEERTENVLFPRSRPRDFLRSAIVEAVALPVIADDELSPKATSRPTSHDATPLVETCEMGQYEPQRVVIHASLKSPGLLIVSDAWFPGWRAMRIDHGGVQELPILRTNRVMRGVWLPAGRHTILFTYRPTSFLVGAGLSIASWASLAAIAASVGLLSAARVSLDRAVSCGRPRRPFVPKK